MVRLNGNPNLQKKKEKKKKKKKNLKIGIFFQNLEKDT